MKKKYTEINTVFNSTYYHFIMLYPNNNINNDNHTFRKSCMRMAYRF